MTRMLLLLLLIAIGFPAEGVQQDAEAAPYDDEEAYAVYAAVLPEIWNWELAEPPEVVLQQETASVDPSTRVGELGVKGGRAFRRDWTGVLGSYISENRKSRKLVRKFPIPNPYQIVSEEDVRSASKNRG